MSEVLESALPRCRGDSVHRMIFFPPQEIDGERVIAGGKLILPAGFEEEPLSQLERLLVVLPGLPGEMFGLSTEKKGRRVVSSNTRMGVLRLVPQGINGGYNLGVSPEVRKSIEAVCPDFFAGEFSLKKHLLSLFAALKSLADLVPPAVEQHAAGHSFGAMALLYALRLCAEHNVPVPHSANFWAPFVKIAVGEGVNDDIALSIINTRMETGRVYAQESALDALDQGVFQPVLAKYHVKSPDGLKAEHRELYGPGRFDEIGDLQPILDGRCRVRIVEGKRDPYIDRAHARVIAMRTGVALDRTLRELPDDGHDLRSLDIRDAMAA